MAREFTLPPAIMSPSDIARMQRNLESFNDARKEAELRSRSGVVVDEVQPSALLRIMAQTNDCDLNIASHRDALLTELTRIVKEAPTVTISFAVDPPNQVMSKLVAWLRDNVHPQVLVRIGLQPNIAAGCIVRTPSKEYDFSLRSRFAEQRPLLIRRLKDATRKSVTIKAPTREATP